MKALKIRLMPTIMVFMMAGLGGFYLPMPRDSAFAPASNSAEATP